MSYLYEILIRGNADGSIAGATQTMATVNADGSISIGQPTALVPSAVLALLGSDFPASAAVSSQLAAANATIVDLQSQIKQLQASPVVAPQPTQTVSRRQFVQACAQSGVITDAAAIALLATGTIPANVQAIISTLPLAEQFPAELAIVGDTSFTLSNPLMTAIGTALGMTEAQLSSLFTLAASL
jgi:hypothetical protein